jgi:hypothetical protein
MFKFQPHWQSENHERNQENNIHAHQIIQNNNFSEEKE